METGTPPRDTAWAMSDANVEVVRRALEKFRAGVELGDPGAFFDLESVDDDYSVIHPGGV
jgi:hypothetical protein